MIRWFFFFQAEDGIRDLVRSRGLGDVYKRQEAVRATGASGAQVLDYGIVPQILPAFAGISVLLNPSRFPFS